MVTVLVRPEALLTFSVLSLAASLGAESRPLRTRVDTSWGKRDG